MIVDVARLKSLIIRLGKSSDSLPGKRTTAWLGSAAASLLSSRRLLVECSVHFPLKLLLLQLSTATVISIGLHIWQQRTQSSRASSSISVSAWLAHSAVAAIAALSIVFTMQAILHIQNLPTLGMLTPVTCLVEGVIVHIVDRKTKLSLAVLRILVLICACVGVLVGEHSLKVAALLTSLPAVLLAGAARGANGILDARGIAGPGFAQRRLLHCFIGVVVTITCTYTLTEESWSFFRRDFHQAYIPLLLFNLVVSSAAILQGQSILLTVDELENENARDSRGISDAVVITTVTAILGATSTLMVRRPWMSWLQLVCFAVAIGVVATSDASPDDTRRQRYTALTALAKRRSDEREAPSESEDLDETPLAKDDRSASRWQTSISFFAIAGLWLAFIILNFSPVIHQKIDQPLTSLDTKYKPSFPLEIVISMYKEPVSEVTHLISTVRAMPNLANAKVHIYIKDSEADVDAIKASTGSDSIEQLANIGREGETYLYHILNHWDTLAHHTVFLQADVHNPREFYPRIRNYFDPKRTGMLNLGWPGTVCDCDSCTDNFGFHDTTRILPGTHARIDNSTRCRHVFLSYKGQFIVSARRIRGIDKQIYKDLHTALVDKNSWAHGEEFLEGQRRKDSMSAPVFGYTLERMWNVLFQCNDLEVAWKCASLLSGTRIGGGIEDCQCFD